MNLITFAWQNRLFRIVFLLNIVLNAHGLLFDSAPEAKSTTIQEICAQNSSFKNIPSRSSIHSILFTSVGTNFPSPSSKSPSFAREFSFITTHSRTFFTVLVRIDDLLKPNALKSRAPPLQ